MEKKKKKQHRMRLTIVYKEIATKGAGCEIVNATSSVGNITKYNKARPRKTLNDIPNNTSKHQ